MVKFTIKNLSKNFKKISNKISDVHVLDKLFKKKVIKKLLIFKWNVFYREKKKI